MKRVKTKERTIVFMGTGGMWSYSIGFADYLRNNFDLSHCKFTGLSGGTMASALACQPRTINGYEWHKYTMVEGMREIQDDYLYTRLYTTLGRRCKDTKWNDEKWHLRCKDRFFIPQWSHVDKKEKIIKEWDNTNDMVDCILASCHIPLAIDGRYACPYKDDFVFDIGLPGFNCEKYEYFNPNPEAPFFYLGPRNQFRSFPLVYQTIYKQPAYMQYLYDTGYNDAKKCSSLLKAFIIDGQDLFLGEGDMPQKYSLRERWHESPLVDKIEEMIQRILKLKKIFLNYFQKKMKGVFTVLPKFKTKSERKMLMEMQRKLRLSVHFKLPFLIRQKNLTSAIRRHVGNPLVIAEYLIPNNVEIDTSSQIKFDGCLVQKTYDNKFFKETCKGLFIHFSQSFLMKQLDNYYMTNIIDFSPKRCLMLLDDQNYNFLNAMNPILNFFKICNHFCKLNRLPCELVNIVQNYYIRLFIDDIYQEFVGVSLSKLNPSSSETIHLKD